MGGVTGWGRRPLAHLLATVPQSSPGSVAAGVEVAFALALALGAALRFAFWALGERLVVCFFAVVVFLVGMRGRWHRAVVTRPGRSRRSGRPKATCASRGRWERRRAR